MSNRLFVSIATLFIFLSALPSSINASMGPGNCGPGCQVFSFSLSGTIQGVSPSSPLYSYVHNGDTYTATGWFFSDGSLRLDQIRMSADPHGCGAGCSSGLVIEPPPGMCSGGCLVTDSDPGR